MITIFKTLTYLSGVVLLIITAWLCVVNLYNCYHIIYQKCVEKYLSKFLCNHIQKLKPRILYNNMKILIFENGKLSVHVLTETKQCKVFFKRKKIKINKKQNDKAYNFFMTKYQ